MVPIFHPIGRLLGHTDGSMREGLALADRGASDRYTDFAWRRAHREEQTKKAQPGGN